MVSETMKEVRSFYNGNRGSAKLDVDWDTPGSTASKTLAVRNVRAGNAPLPLQSITLLFNRTLYKNSIVETESE